MSFIQSSISGTFYDESIVYRSAYFEAKDYSEIDHHRYGVELPPSLSSAINKRRAEYLVGRVLAKAALLEAGASSTYVGIGKNREPIWPPDYIGSISHCSDYAVCVAIRQDLHQGIGIDVESIMNIKQADHIAHEIVNKTELKLFSKLSQPTNELISLAFSTKEAFFKAAFNTVGHYFGFTTVSILGIRFASINTVTFEVNRSLHSSLPSGKIFEAEFKCIDNKVCVCVIL